MTEHDDAHDTHDPLAALMRRADPARRRGHAEAPPHLDRLLEDTVTLDQHTLDRTQPDHAATAPRWRRPALVAAAAALLLGAGLGGVALAGLGDAPDAPAPATAEAEVLALTLPQDAATASCAMVTPEALRGIPVAFDGRVVDVADDRVTLEVDRWFAGGDADVVTVASSDPALVPLLGGIDDFRDGGRYLVSASQGQVSVCGFSGPWSPELEQLFEAAYAG